NEEKIRYHKVIIMTDADVDGSHIQTLLLTFFFRYLPKIIENGYLFLAQPPLYRYKKGKKEIYFKDDAAMNNFLIENGIESLEMEGVGSNDLISFFKMVDHYQGSLSALERRYALVSLIRHFVENPDLIGLKSEMMMKEIESFLNAKGNNILTKTVTDEEIHLFVQTGDGMEELRVNDELFAAPHFTEALYVYDKIKEWNMEIEGDIIEVLESVKEFAKKGSYIQRYKGLGEMNPEQLWETTMTPENRVLLRVNIEDAEAASDAFILFMGDEVEPRRNYIETHAKDVKHLDV
ncbi:MAG: toprim domain-containing protein, partial [Thiovulaceae bacterium]|nr:toprim domain-containing protein [Sulfurimonadaceae bacterium]